MADWLKSMEQTYEYYIVDPGTWKDMKKLNDVKSCTITRDAEADTLGSATIDIVESVGECYVRVYLVTIQNGITEKHPLGTFLVQTPSSSFDGKKRDVSMDAYTPLIELRENPPPIGYSILAENKDGSYQNIMENAVALTSENLRAPVVNATCDKTLYYDFVASMEETWLSYISDLIANAKYTFGLDELGRILFLPKQDIASLQPVWTYNDDNSSILLPEITMKHDIYQVPNVVEVVYANGADSYYAVAINDDPNSPTSTVNRGRIIKYRDTSPQLAGVLIQSMVDEYAEKLLEEKSTVEYTVTYTHGYCPVRLGDCVRLNYEAAGITDIKAKVISQNIKCKAGCQVTEKAAFTTKLWR